MRARVVPEDDSCLGSRRTPPRTLGPQAGTSGHVPAKGRGGGGGSPHPPTPPPARMRGREAQVGALRPAAGWGARCVVRPALRGPRTPLGPRAGGGPTAPRGAVHRPKGGTGGRLRGAGLSPARALKRAGGSGPRSLRGARRA